MSLVNERDESRKGDRLIPIREAQHITGISRTGIYAKIREGAFPQPVKVGKLTRFSLRECESYVASLLARRA